MISTCSAYNTFVVNYNFQGSNFEIYYFGIALFLNLSLSLSVMESFGFIWSMSCSEEHPASGVTSELLRPRHPKG